MGPGAPHSDGRVAIQVDLDPRVNYAMQQNDVPVVKRLRIENVWYDGEPSVLFPRPRGALDDILEDTHA